MASVRATHCCGVSEISNLQTCKTGEQVMRMLKTKFPGSDWDYLSGYPYKRLPNSPPSIARSHLTFIQANGSYGEMLRRFIRANKLGSVTASQQARNPNSGANIIVYVWALDHNAIRQWYTKHPPKSKGAK